jgi:hypothetical protein
MGRLVGEIARVGAGGSAGIIENDGADPEV